MRAHASLISDSISQLYRCNFTILRPLPDVKSGDYGGEILTRQGESSFGSQLARPALSPQQNAHDAWISFPKKRPLKTADMIPRSPNHSSPNCVTSSLPTTMRSNGRFSFLPQSTAHQVTRNSTVAATRNLHFSIMNDSSVIMTT